MTAAAASASLRLLVAFAAFTFSVLLLMIAFHSGLNFGNSTHVLYEDGGNITQLQSSPHRKLLIRSDVAFSSEMEPKRIWGDKCSKSDIAIYQSPTTPLPSGIPTYTVEIVNECVNGCDISGIHFSCGWFSSARLINPRIFKRLRYDDCVVNDGKPLVNGRILSFRYANTFLYPLSVSSVVC
ncbi:hypothetical protein RJ640_014036 [Escallonia rubra]|uniref:Protein TAPETUM DETERMINANT 1 n=1 Tax=Escallonia rubra TaxID=112253 RepID=A0AA88RFT7_9ASTE|nr:hypothetical protein RJ640_014036 [Escallonia rubra]